MAIRRRRLEIHKRFRRSRRTRVLAGQTSFAELAPDPGWASTRPPSPRRMEAPELLPDVRAQALNFEASLVAQGIVRANSALTYRKALECLAKQAERHLGRPLDGLGQLYNVDLIAALAADDEPFDGSTYQLSRYTMRQRRVVLTAYLRALGIPGLTFEEGRQLLKEGFRRASRRRGYRYVIPAGRPEQRDRYRPPLDDAVRFLAAAANARHAYAGPRLAAAVALTLWQGLRPVSVLAIDGTDFEWRRGALFLTYKEKTAKGKRKRRPIQLRPPAIYFLRIYIAAFNSYAARRGWPHRIGFGIPEAFFRGLRGRRWTYETLHSAYARCCRIAGVAPFPAYGVRRLYASGIAAVLPMEEAAVAGGWVNERVYSRHYARSLREWQPPLALAEPAIDLNDDRPELSPFAVNQSEVLHD